MSEISECLGAQLDAQIPDRILPIVILLREMEADCAGWAGGLNGHTLDPDKHNTSDQLSDFDDDSEFLVDAIDSANLDFENYSRFIEEVIAGDYAHCLDFMKNQLIGIEIFEKLDEPAERVPSQSVNYYHKFKVSERERLRALIQLLRCNIILAEVGREAEHMEE